MTGDRYEGSFAAGSAGAFGPGATAQVHNHYCRPASPYVLQPHRDEPAGLAELRELRDQPSRLLLARRQAVPFSGHEDLLERLTAWLEGDGPAAWLFHAPGGQGKTRLASHVASLAARRGWTAVWAQHGTGEHPGAPPEGPVLVVADYADRWPAEDLGRLAGDLARHEGPVRIILLARSAAFWSHVDSHCEDLGYATAASGLAPPAGARRQLFDAACARFAEVYELEPRSFDPPGSLAAPEYGLTLALHMAALAAVDAAASHTEAPSGPARLSEYLLKRESRHWYGGDARRAVFAAAVLGPASNSAALAALEAVGLPSAQGWTRQGLLDEHTRRYPAPGQATVLEPLCPDLLAEDFIALTLPGSEDSVFADPWSTEALRTMTSGDIEAPVWTPRGLFFLIAAARRWPHVRTGHLEPLLLADPALAVEAGQAGLTALAEDPAISVEVLAAVESAFPPAGERHASLDPGLAAVSRRLAGHRVPRTASPAERARIHHETGLRLGVAGRYEEALSAHQESARLYQLLADVEPGYRSRLVAAMYSLGSCLVDVHRYDEAIDTLRSAVAQCRDLVREEPGRHVHTLGAGLCGLSRSLACLGQYREAFDAIREAATVYRGLAGAAPGRFLPDLAQVLGNLGNGLLGLGRHQEALAAFEESFVLYGRLAARSPAQYRPDVARALANLARAQLLIRKDLNQALADITQAIGIQSPLAEQNPEAYGHMFFLMHQVHQAVLTELGRA
ncbi:tetratricopeptide repeat protein [Longispora albida]|uniref:tetratricopeptide repeat protein n=1 Tax=Longispora albida TaxID=203523 RepID=UPI0003A79FAC|nr:tetratricopeptide repeat protein [Longispora albida]